MLFIVIIECKVAYIQLKKNNARIKNIFIVAILQEYILLKIIIHTLLTIRVITVIKKTHIMELVTTQ